MAITKRRFRPTFTNTMLLVEKAAQLRRVDGYDILRRTRSRRVAFARFGVVWVLRQGGAPYARISEALGFGDHSSVMFAEKRAIELREDEDGYRQFTDELLAYSVTLGPLVEEVVA